jgi:hypothetical protein
MTNQEFQRKMFQRISEALIECNVDGGEKYMRHIRELLEGDLTDIALDKEFSFRED